ncbi:PadR family transcriptional regulator [Pelotomaculum isophthalicicum JI]|uniref:PadR family transcriptional regulator n=1 Tax=Pelotomaculum isophthalicicum JI TaxID=947010 RepID=A0A9X4JW94_9FIRM|nr:PadR family transcriptional regulator [Pelotomaculum isophthalicicum]MDF9408802.1 PadR family transcriptional regulator [Pelotomaculum isophthalicicum JI]
MSLPYAILGLLTYQPMTGYDLKQYFDHSINYFWSAHQSQIYRELAALEGKGFLDSRVEPQEGRPDRKVYSITAAGETELQKWLKQFPQSLTTPVRDELLVRIFFASRLPLSELKFQLQRYLREKQEQMAAFGAVDGLISEQPEIPGHPDESFYWRLTLKYGIAHAKAAIEWAKECIRDIEKKEGLQETRDHERSRE